MSAPSLVASASAAEQHETVKNLLHRAVLLPPSERPGFLRRATSGDPGLLAELESLLSHFEAPDAGGEQSSLDANRRLASPPRPSLASGTVLAGRYEIERLVGRGGMGEVYAARDRLLDDTVALKMLASAGRGYRTRMRDEVRLARRISHPGVCRVHDLGEHDGEPFLTMELVEGASLAERLQRGERFDSLTITRLAAEVSAGLAAAHHVGVIHRDLKPGNVLVGRDGKARLTDFGIASSLRVSHGISEQDRSLFGSPIYMAPEELGASAPVTERTDLYSLGVLVYELAVGRPPFDSADQFTLREMHCFATPERPSRLAPLIDPALETLVLRLLRKRPADRPASAESCAAAFETIARRLSSTDASTCTHHVAPSLAGTPRSGREHHRWSAPPSRNGRGFSPSGAAPPGLAPWRGRRPAPHRG